ncbi:hypothetical protein [Paenibacillus sp. IITD108]|uniref:hypothetical protein n=1 Tax=Paenibacillus sp. IITD108 TaxID=3116649 RepID=UPI002F412D11
MKEKVLKHNITVAKGGKIHTQSIVEGSSSLGGCVADVQIPNNYMTRIGDGHGCIGAIGDELWTRSFAVSFDDHGFGSSTLGIVDSDLLRKAGSSGNEKPIACLQVH